MKLVKDVAELKIEEIEHPDKLKTGAEPRIRWWRSWLEVDKQMWFLANLESMEIREFHDLQTQRS